MNLSSAGGRLPDLRMAKTRDDAPHSAFVGSLGSFRNYLNEEFNRVIVELAATDQWWALSPRGPPTIMNTENSGTSTSQGWDELERQLITEHGRPPRALLFVVKFHWNFGTLAQLGRRCDRHLTDTDVVVLVDDLHWYEPGNTATQRHALAQADIVLAAYAHAIPLLYQTASSSADGAHRPHQQLAWLGHATTAPFFKPLKGSGDLVNRVLLSGATTQSWYPYRHMAHRWIVRKHDRRFAMLDHPGYTHFSENPFIGRGFSLQLNKYCACLTDGLHLNYTIAKVFEIPAAGCLLLINAEMRSLLARLGLFDGVHFLSYGDWNSLNALVDRVIDPRNARKMKAMRKRAQALVLWRHVVVHRAAGIHASLQLAR